MWLMLLVLLHYSYADHEENLCHKSYYKWPECINHPDGYGCECGPGFYWNTHICVALGVDSRFEFSSSQTQYALLLDKPFPELEDFTISFWVRPTYPIKRGTILSYSHGNIRDMLKITAGPTLHMQVHKKNIDMRITFNSSLWTHIAWTYSNDKSKWQLFVNGEYSKGKSTDFPKIPGGGDLVLGQSAPESDIEDSYNAKYAFIGGMSFVNIYSRVLTTVEIKRSYEDCFYMECGNAVEWTDFRSGTRGSLKVRWPSGILGTDTQQPCFTDPDAFTSCDRYCSLTIGAQCNAEIVENIEWQRTPADADAVMPCPNRHVEEGVNGTKFAVRRCVRHGEYLGRWKTPDLEQCVSLNEYAIKTEISNLSHGPVNESDILRLASKLENQTADGYYDNPCDIATVIDSVHLLVQSQNMSFRNTVAKRGPRTYGLDRDLDRQKYPTWQDSQGFATEVTTVLDNLLLDKHDLGWNAQNPQGAEGDQFLQAVMDLMDILASSLQFHVSRADVDWHDAEVVQATSKIAFIVKMYRTHKLTDLHFPYEAARKRLMLEDKPKDHMVLPGKALQPHNTSVMPLPDLLLISTARFDAARILPNHDLKTKSKDNNVNSGVYSLHFHMMEENDQYKELQNLTVPVKLKFQYLDNFNISNPECVRLIHATNKATWHWNGDGCRLVKNNTWYAWCECHKPGIYAIITDMYDDNWVKAEEPLILMAVPSYIGCSASALMCLFSALMLIYLRTASNTSSLHKHFALSIIGSQCSFMLGIDRTEHQVLCQVCAIAFHYFFLATFSWLMNEAFNLYIIITYAAHSHGEHTEGGSQWRFYILGWVLPGILVGAFVGAHTDDYYAPDMCWIDWQYVWLFLGPAIGMISVTILVMIFTAKEHHESSYSKNETTNNHIVVYSKALWTQIILLTVCWFFAILSIRMRGVIIKWIYALFNTIQGAFFVVFYFLLNEEIRTVYKANVKKNSLAKQGYDYSPTGSMDEGDDVVALTAVQMPNETDVAQPGSSSSHHKAAAPASQPRCGIETSDEEEDGNIEAEDEASDNHGLMTTTV